MSEDQRGPTAQGDDKLGWGMVDEDGSEMWHAPPTIRAVNWRARAEWLFRPKRFLLDRFLRLKRGERLLDFGCGTGGLLIDLCRLRGATGIGVDVSQRQVEIAEEQARRFGAQCTFELYDGSRLPFPDGSFDAACSKDVLGHVPDIQAALRELHRVLKPGGRFAVFSESRLGSGSSIVHRLSLAGVNVDPFAEFHVSVFPRAELLGIFETTGFHVCASYSAVVHRFWLYPEWFEAPLSESEGFPVYRAMNRSLLRAKRRLGHPGKALANLLSVVDTLTFGRWAECAGLYVLARKRS